MTDEMTKPMFEGEPMTRREILIAREAFATGARLWTQHPEAEAKRRYPLLVEKPRVVTDREETLPSARCDWRVIDGALEWRISGVPNPRWYPLTNSSLFLTADRVRLLADLLANPTELSED